MRLVLLILLSKYCLSNLFLLLMGARIHTWLFVQCTYYTCLHKMESWGKKWGIKMNPEMPACRIQAFSKTILFQLIYSFALLILNTKHTNLFERLNNKLPVKLKWWIYLTFTKRFMDLQTRTMGFCQIY